MTTVGDFIGVARNRDSDFLLALTIKQKILDRGPQVVMVHGDQVVVLSLGDDSTDAAMTDKPSCVAGTFDRRASGREIASSISYTHNLNQRKAS